MFEADLGKIGAMVTLDDSEYRQKLGKLPGLTQQFLGGIGKLAAGYLGFRAITNSIKDVTQAYIVQERAEKSVQASLRAQGQEWRQQTEDLANYASELQKVTVYGDEQTLQTMSMGMNMGISSKQIKEAARPSPPPSRAAARRPRTCGSCMPACWPWP